MKIHLAADHAGYDLKETLKCWLSDHGHEPVDHGAHARDLADDYPDFIGPAADALAADPAGSRAVLIGGSGQGEAMVANRRAGVRAAVLYRFDERAVKLSREHNNANALSLGARFLSDEEAIAALHLWLDTSFSEEERHKRRLAKF